MCLLLSLLLFFPPFICLFTSYLFMRWSTIHLFYFKYDLHYSEYLKRRPSIIFNTKTLTNSTETCGSAQYLSRLMKLHDYLGDCGWTSCRFHGPLRKNVLSLQDKYPQIRRQLSLRTRATCSSDCTYCCLPSYQEQIPYHVIMCLCLQIMDWMLSALSSSCVKMSNTPLFRLIMDWMLLALFSSCVKMNNTLPLQINHGLDAVSIKMSNTLLSELIMDWMLSALYSSCAKMSNTLLSKLNMDWLLCLLFQLLLFCAVNNRGHNHYVCVIVCCGR